MRSWARSHIPEIAWAIFAAIEFATLLELQSWPTVPFHFVWLSLTILYGFRVWGMRATLLVLGVVCAVSTAILGSMVLKGTMHVDELTEIPLMGAMFLAMVWHAQRRQAALEAVSRSAERERDFVHDASHRLKTPIAISRGLTQLMLQSDAEGQLREDLEGLNDELRRLSGIAENLLVLATAEQQDAIFLEAVAVEEVVTAAAKRWRHAAPRDWALEVRARGILRADRGRLDAAIDALVENAIEATQDGDRIEVGVRAEGGQAVIEVVDAGHGVPEELLPRVFERFASSRHGGATRRGAGLGLPIVKAVAAAHNGSVRLSSESGRGTRVSLTLPGFVASPVAAGRELAQAARTTNDRAVTIHESSVTTLDALA
jgi:signal transduction histidine kinase